MNRVILVSLILGLAGSAVYAYDTTDDGAGQGNQFIFHSDIHYEPARFAYQDSVEWSTVALAGAADYLLFQNLLTPSSTSLFSGLDLDKPYTEEALPTWIGVIGIAAVGHLLFFLPNNAGWMNYEGYINVKGYMESIISTMLVVDILKFAVAEKRPDYQARLKTGDQSIINDGMLSFPSNHTAVAFATSTYLSLFVFQYLGDWRRPELLGMKLLLITGLNAVSFGVAAERVIDNKHHVQDVIAGGLIGSGLSLLFYGVQNWMGIYPKVNTSSRLSVYPDTEALGVDVEYRF